MREVFSHPDFTQVGYYKSILDEAGIASYIRDEHTNNVLMAGAIFSPSLCIINDTDYDRAKEILKSRQSKETPTAAEWSCLSCEEKNPPNFEICWNCNTARPIP